MEEAHLRFKRLHDASASEPSMPTLRRLIRPSALWSVLFEATAVLRIGTDSKAGLLDHLAVILAKAYTEASSGLLDPCREACWSSSSSWNRPRMRRRAPAATSASLC